MNCHKSTFGDFGKQLLVDRNGYTYTTIKEWLTDANVGNDLVGYSYKEKEEWAREQAAYSRLRLKNASNALADWQSYTR